MIGALITPKGIFIVSRERASDVIVAQHITPERESNHTMCRDAESNAASIDEIPTDYPAGNPLPGSIRQELRRLAASGEDVYAYTGAGLTGALAGEQPRFYVWRGDVRDPDTGYRGVRLPVDAWRTWPARYVEDLPF